MIIKENGIGLQPHAQGEKIGRYTYPRTRKHIHEYICGYCQAVDELDAIDDMCIKVLYHFQSINQIAGIRI